jgi:wyosine [tRNA(Phe)-imidazoG37] synthetase (radical SAM superfamily)
MFDALNYGLEAGVIAPTATWQVSSGEIAIHPYKERILSLVKDYRAMFYTNCFIFDEGVANNLSKNQNSAINLSIDSGTPGTWLKVKGTDNFDTVTDNLVKYYTASAKPGQITLKYIVLPGVNDNLEDYRSVIEIMKVLQIKHLELARDTRIKYSDDAEYSENLIGAAGYLVALLHRNGMSFGLFTYKPNERERVVAFANELLKSGEV